MGTTATKCHTQCSLVLRRRCAKRCHTAVSDAFLPTGTTHTSNITLYNGYTLLEATKWPASACGRECFVCAIRTNQGAANDRIDESNTLHNVCRVSGLAPPASAACFHFSHTTPQVRAWLSSTMVPPASWCSARPWLARRQCRRCSTSTVSMIPR